MKQAIAKLLYTKREIMMDIKAAGAAAGNVGGRPDSGPPEHFNVQPPNDISLVVNSLYSIVGERLIGTTPPPRPQNNKAKHCQRCIDYRQDGYDCGGRGGWKCCAYFEADSAKILPEGNAKCKRCLQFLEKMLGHAKGKLTRTSAPTTFQMAIQCNRK